MTKDKFPRIDLCHEIRDQLLPHCRLKYGEIWQDNLFGHRVGCLDATDVNHITALMRGDCASLAVHDPPYNLAVFETRTINDYLSWCSQWIDNTMTSLLPDSSLYVWLGADQNRQFQPLADFIIMMRNYPVRSRSLITLRNQRGYGTQRNWMAIRQELLYYVIGNPVFNVNAEYTDIPKILRGYYKDIGGRRTENLQRSKSDNIRAGNVWVDIQQVFYRLTENVPGCYAQKPLAAIKRIISASSQENDVVIDFFAHSGTTLIASEQLRRKCYTCDLDPLFCELSIRRLEHYRTTGQPGWQNKDPFGITKCGEN